MEMSMLAPALPEIVMAVAAMALLLLGVFRKEDSTRFTAAAVVAVMAIAAFMIWSGGGARALAFNGMFVTDGFAVFTKILVLLAAAVAVIMSVNFLVREKIARFEYPVVMLFATIGMLMMISANDLMSLYLGLELQSLSLYVLAAYQRDSSKATEAGLKYFVLGSLASGMLLYGASMVYGFAGSTSFEVLAKVFHEAEGSVGVGVIIGMVFVMAGLAFKISAVPFHMWTPDVYEGAPTPVTSFFAVAPKVAAFALFVRVMVGPFAELFEQWQQVVVLISLGSMILGAFAAIGQNNIKRLMAYSSIGHMGYALMGLACGNTDGIRGVLVYLAIYLFMNVGTFAVILAMRQKGRMVEGIGDLAGLSRTNPMMALVLAIFMFSMAGIPPLAGFWSKLAVFMAAIDSGLIFLAIVGVLTSVVGAYYYLRIIKVMYFDEPAESFDRPMPKSLATVMGGSAVLIVLFTLAPAPLMSGAEAAAAVLFGG